MLSFLYGFMIGNSIGFWIAWICATIYCAVKKKHLAFVDDDS